MLTDLVITTSPMAFSHPFPLSVPSSVLSLIPLTYIHPLPSTYHAMDRCTVVLSNVLTDHLSKIAKLYKHMVCDSSPFFMNFFQTQ
jgi:hypothetical protein